MKHEMQQCEKNIPQTAFFPRFARNCVWLTGHPLAFSLAVIVIICWAVIGPICKFSDSWQLVINTVTSVITFGMVFLIQNSQNRDTEMLQRKLAELVRVTRSTHNAISELAELPEKRLASMQINPARSDSGVRYASRNNKSNRDFLDARPDNGCRVLFIQDLIDGKSASTKGATNPRKKENI
jgi:low affinity Fe/Cu permease